MKIKFWQFEYEFDRDDAKIVIPIVLLLVAISVGGLNPLLLLGASAVYYLVYFFSAALVQAIENQLQTKNAMSLLQESQNLSSRVPRL